MQPSLAATLWNHIFMQGQAFQVIAQMRGIPLERFASLTAGEGKLGGLDLLLVGFVPNPVAQFDQ